MRFPRHSHKGKLAIFLAVFGVLAMAGSAAAVVYIYKNDFSSGSEYRDVKRTGGKANACSDSYGSKTKTMRVEVKGNEFCQYSPPVTADADQPDHEIVASGRILDSTPKNAKKRAYLGVRVRVGGGTYYEFRVTPKGRKYLLTRSSPGGASGLPIKGESNEIKAIGEQNKLRLRVTDAAVTAFVNGQSVANYDDPNPANVKGRTVAFGVGNTKDSRNGPIGSFKSIQVGVPTP